MNLMKQEFKETWLPLLHMAHHKDGTPMYEISNTGHIRMKTAKGYKPIKSSPNPDGYHVVNLLNAIFLRQRFYVHRLVAVTFINNPFGYDTVDHIDGDKGNNAIRNLRWVSRSTNISLGHALGKIRQNFPKHPVRLEKNNRQMVFETMSKAACFLEVSIHAILAGMQGKFKPKGWTVISLVPKEVNGNIFTDADFE